MRRTDSRVLVSQFQDGHSGSCGLHGATTSGSASPSFDGVAAGQQQQQQQQQQHTDTNDDRLRWLAWLATVAAQAPKDQAPIPVFVQQQPGVIYAPTPHRMLTACKFVIHEGGLCCAPQVACAALSPLA
jgi:hypothetical protein